MDSSKCRDRHDQERLPPNHNPPLANWWPSINCFSCSCHGMETMRYSASRSGLSKARRSWRTCSKTQKKDALRTGRFVVLCKGREAPGASLCGPVNTPWPAAWRLACHCLPRRPPCQHYRQSTYHYGVARASPPAVNWSASISYRNGSGANADRLVLSTCSAVLNRSFLLVLSSCSCCKFHVKQVRRHSQIIHTRHDAAPDRAAAPDGGSGCPFCPIS
jgi:hypothetical protein